jgi:hypothetical protein
MHIVELAVSDTRLAAAIAQAPLTDGFAAAMMSTPKNGGRLFALALLDRFGSLFGRDREHQQGGVALELDVLNEAVAFPKVPANSH